MKVLSKRLILIKRILSIRMYGNMGIHCEPRIFILYNIWSTWSRLRIIFYSRDIRGLYCTNHCEKICFVKGLHIYFHNIQSYEQSKSINNSNQTELVN